MLDGKTGEIIYTIAGTYSFTPPTYINQISVFCVGAGGGAGGGASAGGGGGGAGASWKNNITVSSTQTYQIKIGKGGKGSFGCGYNGCYGEQGEDSTAFGIIAGGGKGGSHYYGDHANVVGGDGGISSGGDANFKGGKGVSQSNYYRVLNDNGNAGVLSDGKAGNGTESHIANGGYLGGAGGGSHTSTFGGGGGVSLYYGINGESGAKSNISNIDGNQPFAGKYGGGGASGYDGYAGENGACRIIWSPSNDRGFPDTNADKNDSMDFYENTMN